jgi:hypothetical protein
MGRRYHHAKLPSNGFVAEILLTANPRGGVIIIDKDNAYYTTNLAKSSPVPEHGHHRR